MGSSAKEWDENTKYSKWMRAQERRKARLTEALAHLETLGDEGDTEDRYLEGFTVKYRRETAGDVLVTLKASKEGARFVAFHSEESLIDALTKAAGRWMAGQLNWREDEYSPGG